jgi:hypothetical protein
MYKRLDAMRSTERLLKSVNMILVNTFTEDSVLAELDRRLELASLLEKCDNLYDDDCITEEQVVALREELAALMS